MFEKLLFAFRNRTERSRSRRRRRKVKLRFANRVAAFEFLNPISQSHILIVHALEFAAHTFEFKSHHTLTTAMTVAAVITIAANLELRRPERDEKARDKNAEDECREKRGDSFDDR